ncbi:MAG: shikimate dehydrogenase [Candidatus Omnitrophica bacterium]|nr:shikimate dehydrogenase [Candidatus Omnitrophota bacterium]
MKIYGLIGYPVRHSYSSAMHNAAFQALGVDARYELFEIKPEQLEQEFNRLLTQGICGFNVTIPYKEKVIKLLGQLDEQAALIGAVNTIQVNQDKSTIGFNTDGPGFITHLKQVVGFNTEGKGVAILGAGGAAKAVALELARNKVKAISLFDLDQDKTQALADKIEENFPACALSLGASANDLLKIHPDLLINATPLGMHKDDPLVFDPGLLERNLVVYDLVYNPAQTPLLRAAKSKGCSGVFNGLGMLLYQGVLAFKIWLDVEPPVEVMQNALTQMLT